MSLAKESVQIEVLTYCMHYFAYGRLLHDLRKLLPKIDTNVSISFSESYFGDMLSLYIDDLLSVDVPYGDCTMYLLNRCNYYPGTHIDPPEYSENNIGEYGKANYQLLLNHIVKEYSKAFGERKLSEFHYETHLKRFFDDT